MRDLQLSNYYKAQFKQRIFPQHYPAVYLGFKQMFAD